MTKAEFDLLSASEKVGIINVTDDVSAGLKYVKNVLYTNIDENNWTAQSAGDSITLSDNILDYDEVYFETGFFEANNASGKKLTHLLNNKISAETIALAKSKYGAGSYEGMFDICPITIVSGQTYAAVFCVQVSADNTLSVKYKYINGWNASLWGITRIIGVKYLSEDETIYSTDEKIVGSYVDGRPIYEKTIAISESSFAAGWKWFTANLTCDHLIDAEVWLKDNNPAYCYTSMPVAVDYSNGNIGVCNNMGGTMGNVTGYVTVRYTKATS